MKISSLHLAGIGLFLWCMVVAAAPKAESKGTGLFATLEKGQKVALKELEGRYEIGVLAGVDLGYKVVEVGPDFIVVENLSGVSEIRIPPFSIKSVTITHLPKKQ